MTLYEATRQYQIALEYIRTTMDLRIDEDDDCLELSDADKRWKSPGLSTPLPHEKGRMTSFTNPNYKTNHFDEYSAEEKRQYSSYLWECHECGQRTLTDAGGGVLNPCLKKNEDKPKDHTCGNDGHDYTVTAVIAGHEDPKGPRTTASIEGRKPGEPSPYKLHKQTCIGYPDCLDLAHWQEPDFNARRKAAAGIRACGCGSSWASSDCFGFRGDPPPVRITDEPGAIITYNPLTPQRLVYKDINTDPA